MINLTFEEASDLKMTVPTAYPSIRMLYTSQSMVSKLDFVRNTVKGIFQVLSELNLILSDRAFKILF